MRDYLTDDDICNQISMNRSVFKGTILIAEGITDLRLYSKFVDSNEVKVIPAHSKSNVIKSVDKMSARRDGKIVGIVDRDLDELKGRIFSPPIFYTDYRDLEMMLINSAALDDVLVEYADQERLNRFQKQNGNVRTAIIEACYPLGLLMYVSYLRGYNLNFKNLDFRDFVDKRTLKTDVQKMVNAVIMNTYGSEISRKNVLKDLQWQMEDHKHKEKIARGHDSVDVLLIGLKDSFGSYNSLSINEGGLGGALRLAYSPDDFRISLLYEESSRWANSRGIKLWKINQV
ncbi:MAG: DUF4435 domain-containing protein [Candidatus Methanomethylophilaceae archaeon]|nr:DUF4435 domain-containing protein [Candidatus Methanomethylophilaceae archaeon]